MIIQIDYQNITEDNKEKIIKYSLIKEKFKKKFIYGVLIEKINSNKVIEEAEEVLGVSDNIEIIKKLFFEIRNFSVTPITLLNVVDNFISEINS